jgi:hypothetical protein|tara:strand:- start:1739 stop:2008 length:270 start_codon:yes stop_codon:yes gene_type:complete
MTLTKTKTIDKVEFVGKWRTLQVRTRTDIKENDVVISESYERDSYQLGETLPTDLKPYAQGVWNKALKDALQAEMDAMPVIEEVLPPSE